ncbi:MAG: CBM20 domain-containing protein [Planctomycetota bacterium]
MSFLRSIASKFYPAGQPVSIVVQTPDATPAGEQLYLAGQGPQLGDWSATGLRLKQTGPGTWEAKLRVPADKPLEFKVTRGGWDRVESHADGSDTGNHRVDPAELNGTSVLHTVERWSDAC